MKKFGYRTSPTLAEQVAKINGKQKNRKSYRPSSDTTMKLDGDVPTLYYNSWAGKEYHMITYTDKCMVVTVPGAAEWQTVHNRLAQSLREYPLDCVRILKGPHKGKLGVFSGPYPTYTGSRMTWRQSWVKLSIDSIPLSSKHPTRIGYDGKDLDNARLTQSQQDKIFNTYVKRSNAATDRVKILEVMGFGASFYLDGYPLPKGLTLEHAQVLQAMAQGAGFNSVAHAWMNEQFFGGDASEETQQLLADGLSQMFVDFHKQKREVVKSQWPY